MLSVGQTTITILQHLSITLCCVYHQVIVFHVHVFPSVTDTGKYVRKSYPHPKQAGRPPQ